MRVFYLCLDGGNEVTVGAQLLGGFWLWKQSSAKSSAPRLSLFAGSNANLR